MTQSSHQAQIQAWLHGHLFDEVPMAISVIDREHRILEANRGFSSSFGDWHGRPCHEVYKGLAEPCVRCAARETFSDGKIRSREEQGVTRDGTRIEYLVHMIPLLATDGSIPYVMELSTDISHIKQLEREKVEAERLAAVGETVSGVAHGIKNVLMGLEGGMYAVETGIELGDDERIGQGWVTLQGNVQRISRFVKEFLDFAKGRPTRVTFIDPGEPARHVVELYRERAAKLGVQLEQDIEPGLDAAPLDPDGIHACLANLVSNAIDACSVAERQQRFVVKVSCHDVDGVLVYEVTDNGQGMDYEISRRVFSRFFSTKGSDRGTGLGLLTTKRIVHQHGGQISFRSAEGRGSVFRIELARGALATLPRVPDGDDDSPGADPIENGGRGA